MDRSSAPGLLSVSRRPMSAGPWTGLTSTTGRSGVRHASYRPHALDLSTRPTDELSAFKVSLQYALHWWPKWPKNKCMMPSQFVVICKLPLVISKFLYLNSINKAADCNTNKVLFYECFYCHIL